jgi:hypothetical protein
MSDLDAMDIALLGAVGMLGLGAVLLVAFVVGALAVLTWILYRGASAGGSAIQRWQDRRSAAGLAEKEADAVEDLMRLRMQAIRDLERISREDVIEGVARELRR